MILIFLTLVGNWYFSPCYVFDSCKADYEGITSFLLDFDFRLIVKSSIYEAMSLFVPRFLVKHHHGPKWFDSDI